MNYYKLLSYTGLGSLGLISMTSCNNINKRSISESDPNIILIMTDDQGFGDIAYHGNPDIHTPVLDKMARNSIRFTNFYVSPVSAPTRSSLMTGRYSLRTGVHDTYNGGATMSTEEVTIAEFFKDAGYNTGIFGKWHLGDNYPYRPIDQGFNEAVVHAGGGIGQVGDVMNYFKYDSSYFDPVLWKNGTATQFRGYCSDIYTQEAMNYLTENRNNPFFLYLSFNAPHTPLQVPEKYYNKYKEIEIKVSNYSDKGRTRQNIKNIDEDRAKKVYAMIENIDDNLGLLFNKISELKLDSNTIIIFLTDNGPQQIRFNGGLRGRKGSVFEGGIKVPFFMHYPGIYPEGTDIDYPSAHIDLLPTLLDICGIDVPNNIDGRSLKDLILNETSDKEPRSLFYNWARGFPEPYKNIAVRNGNYKLVGHSQWDSEASDLQLFDLDNDPYEQHNLSGELTEKAEALKNEFDIWYKEIIYSKNLGNTKPIFIGSKFENPVILNRNDASGSEGIWAQEEIFGYWDINVVESGFYDIYFKFINVINSPGTIQIKAGTILRSKQITQYPFNELKMEKVFLKEGKCMFIPSYKSQGKTILPLYVEISKKNL